MALAQLNPIVGAVESNIAMILTLREQYKDIDILVCSELVVSGYPPEDLVRRPAFLKKVRREVELLAKETSKRGPAILLGAPWLDLSGFCYNAALLLDNGYIIANSYKHHLPNYGVFDEVRVFTPAPLPTPISFRGIQLGILICEDMWYPDVASYLASTGAEVLIAINGSPFDINKLEVRRSQARTRVIETGLPLVYVNQVGGQDELVFDGSSFVIGLDQELLIQAISWQETVVSVTWYHSSKGWTCSKRELPQPLSQEENIYQAMMLGLRDYITKNNLPGAILGLSGGIDSALSAAVAVDALGPGRVRGVIMPSPYTAEQSLDDAATVANLLGIQVDIISITSPMQTFNQVLSSVFKGCLIDTTEENIQARLRGVILMALSNKFGYMVLSTGNKSEISVGYTTLYGDMCGGYSVLKDVYKTTVISLSHWRNKHKPSSSFGPSGLIMPVSILTKKPTAELRPDQTDQDNLPPYEQLDAILTLFIEDELDITEVIARGFDGVTVHQVWHLLNIAEYKRRQSSPGVKVTSRSFGRERRYPITNSYRN